MNFANDASYLGYCHTDIVLPSFVSGIQTTLRSSFGGDVCRRQVLTAMLDGDVRAHPVSLPGNQVDAVRQLGANTF